MKPVAEHSVTARPDRCVVEVYDADACLGDEQALEAAEQYVVAGNGYHLYLLCLQPDMPVNVTIRLWDSPPAPPADAEGQVPVTLESETGILVVNQLTFGPAGEITLPEPGIYTGHTWWTGRQPARAYYDQVLQRITDDWTLDQVTEAWTQSPIQERYVLDLGYTGPPLSDEDD
ncbi:hypothetical protein ACF1G0_30090 [Streptomyces sp. NPDC013953]|uniref:hypothetical protein n=1 Tax=Streptomyces sp. NPDC013953 TaxID=3364868 RepID=UPI0036F59480